MARKEDKEKDLQAAINEVKQAFIKPLSKVDYKKIFDAIEKQLEKQSGEGKEKQ